MPEFVKGGDAPRVLFGALKNRQVCRYLVMGEIRDFPIVFFPLYSLVPSLVKNLRAAKTAPKQFHQQV